MQQQVISTDDSAIIKQKEIATDVVDYAILFDTFMTEAGYTLTVADIRNLHFIIFDNDKKPSTKDLTPVAETFLKQKIAEKNSAGIANLGFNPDSNELLKLIAVDPGELQEALQHIGNIEWYDSIVYDLLVKTQQGFALVADYQTRIENRNKVFTSNDRQINALELLQIIADSLNDLQELCNVGGQSIEGLDYLYKKYVVNRRYVQNVK